MYRFQRALALAGLLAVLLPPGSVLADPNHLPLAPALPALRGPVEAPVPPRRPVNPRKNAHMIYEDDRPLRDFDRDRGLTDLCRSGRFRQKRERFLSIRLGGFVHGAVVGGHWSLYDPEGLAVPNLIYAVKDQDTARCEVYVIRHLEPAL